MPPTWRIAHVAQETPAAEQNRARLHARRRRRVARDRSTHRRGLGRARRRSRRRSARRVRRRRRLHRARARRGAAARPRLHARANARAGQQLLGRLAHAAESGAGADVPLRPAAARRTDQPPGPRRHRLARRLAAPLSGHADRDLARPRVSRFGLQRHAASRAPADQALRRQLLAVRNPARAADRAAAKRVREAAAHGRASAELHQPLQGAGDQGAAGAKPGEGARKDGTDRAGACGLAVHVRIPHARFRAESDDGDGRRALRLSRRTTASKFRSSTM